MTEVHWPRSCAIISAANKFVTQERRNFMNRPSWTRRQFIRVGTGAAAVGATGKFTLLQPKPLWASPRPVAPSDTVRFASIGTGVRGCELLQASTHVTGVASVAWCDLCYIWH